MDKTSSQWKVFRILWNLAWACSHLKIQRVFFCSYNFFFFSSNHFLSSNHCLCRGTAPEKHARRYHQHAACIKSHIHRFKRPHGSLSMQTLFFLSLSLSLTHMHMYTDYLPHFLGGHMRSSVHCCPLVISVSTHFLYQFNYITAAIIKIRIKLFQVKGWWCEGNHKWSGSVWKPHGSVKVEMQV